jgi:hypothetical protein
MSSSMDLLVARGRGEADGDVVRGAGCIDWVDHVLTTARLCAAA